ncbi:hypothetical protein LBMAG56_00310 [Verrucomicrobiota bacterium]|nr:hypothetical protein LBMAG56_00310 [Verrucomicrobiota bacterium]
MKKFAPLLALLLTATLSPAQEGGPQLVPRADAQKYAQILADSSKDLADLPLVCELELTKPAAIRAGEAGALVIPDKRVTADKLAKAGKDAVPLGHLWLRNVAPWKNGSPLPNADQRTVRVRSGESTADAQLFVLAVRRNAADKLELLVLGKTKEPVVTLPLEKSTASGDAPLQIQGRKTGEDSGVLTLIFFGQHQAELTLGKPAE